VAPKTSQKPSISPAVRTFGRSMSRSMFRLASAGAEGRLQRRQRLEPVLVDGLVLEERANALAEAT
jgi:hypothetical protein